MKIYLISFSKKVKNKDKFCSNKQKIIFFINEYFFLFKEIFLNIIHFELLSKIDVN